MSQGLLNFESARYKNRKRAVSCASLKLALIDTLTGMSVLKFAKVVFLGGLFLAKKNPRHGGVCVSGALMLLLLLFSWGWGTLRAALQVDSNLSTFYFQPLLSLQRLWCSASFAHCVQRLSNRFFRISKPSLVFGANLAAS